jgi:splicing factor 3A subunit 2
MSAYEQHVEAPDKRYQYILFAAEPYETIAFKIPNQEIDKSEGKFLTKWDAQNLSFSLQLHFKVEDK